VRAHFDGTQVVLDEPAPFTSGEELIVISRETSQVDQKQQRLEELILSHRGKLWRGLEEALEAMPEPPKGEPDLCEILMEERRKQRKMAAEKADQDPCL
jgi:hypothetical protein